jgi:hypothetical protein
VEEVADAVGGAFQDDFRIVLVRHRLQDAGRMRVGERPERHFGAVEQLDGRGAADRLGAGGADLVAGIDLVEIELLRVRSPGMGRQVRRAVVVIALDDFEQVLRRRLLVREDEAAQGRQ